MVILLVSLTQVGCAETVQPQLRRETMFPIELLANDMIVYNAPNASKTFVGPQVISFAWSNGKLTIIGQDGHAQVRPLQKFPHQPMTEEMILRARRNYVAVPRIDELLSGNASPTNYEWALAYEQWLEEIRVLELGIQLQYAAQANADLTALAINLALQMDSSELVRPKTEVVTPQDENSSVRELYVVYRGALLDENGQPSTRVIKLRRDFREPQPPSEWFSEKEALDLHHAIYQFMESSTRPVIIDLSAGETYISVEK